MLWHTCVCIRYIAAYICGAYSGGGVHPKHLPPKFKARFEGGVIYSLRKFVPFDCVLVVRAQLTSAR